MFVKIKKILRKCVDVLWKLFGRRYRYVNIFSYTANHSEAALLQDGAETTVYSHPRHFERLTENTNCDIQNSSTIYDWLARITNAKCFPYSDLIITSDKKAIYDIKNYKQFAQYANYEDGVIWRDRDTYCKIRYLRTIDVEKGFFLGGLYAHNYYHFMTQIVPKFKYIAQIPSNVPLLLPPHCDGDNNFHQIIEMLMATYSSDRQILYMRRNRAYRVKELYLSSAQSLLLPDIKDNSLGLKAEWCSYKRSAIDYVRSALLPMREKAGSYPKKIYILRRSTNGLRQYNEKEISEKLQTKGFTPIAPEEYTICEQIALFHSADYIIASSGAALTNLMFCHTGCKLIIINSFIQDGGVYNTLADIMQVENLTVNAMESGTDIHQSFTLDPQHLLSAMQELKMIE